MICRVFTLSQSIGSATESPSLHISLADKLPPLCAVTITRLMDRVDFGAQELIVSHFTPLPPTDETIRAVNLVVILVNMSTDAN